MRCPMMSFFSIPGIGQIKAIQLKAIAELSLRIAKTKKVQSIRMNTSVRQ